MFLIGRYIRKWWKHGAKVLLIGMKNGSKRTDGVRIVQVVSSDLVERRYFSRMRFRKVQSNKKGDERRWREEEKGTILFESLGTL